MSDYPHVRAAFINSIREEGSKQEACDWLQKQWNELCALRKELAEARELLASDSIGNHVPAISAFLERTKP